MHLSAGDADYSSSSGPLQPQPAVADKSAVAASLANEVHMLGSLSHPNVVRFCAVCLEPPMIGVRVYQP
jgi:hypothetical protein